MTSPANIANKQISVQVRGGGAHVAIDVVGYFRPPQGGFVTSVTAGTGLTGGTITSSGTIGLAATQLLPTTACANNQIAKWNGTAWACAADSNGGGTVTNVATGAGLTGGPIATSGTINLATTQLLPTTPCANGQLAQWNGSAWACASVAGGGSGTVTSVGSGTGLTGGPITAAGTLSLATSYQMPQSCASGQVPKSNGAGVWTCANDLGGVGTVTSVATAAGLTGGPITTTGTIGLATTQLLPTVACSNGQIPQWNGSAWTCATPPGAGANITLQDSTSTSVGNIVKPGGVFLHNFATHGTFLGVNAGNFVMTGGNNTGLGYTALGANVSGIENTAVGSVALTLNNSGIRNTAVGYLSLADNTSGQDNTALGRGALANNNADANTGLGTNALNLNQSGVDNTAVGAFSLSGNVTANANTAVGAGVLVSNVDGANNTAVGAYALALNSSGEANSALGNSALNQNTFGANNVAVGGGAAFSNTTGNGNVAVGGSALSDNQVSSGNTAVGNQALVHTTSDANTAIGSGALASNTSGSNNVAVGQGAGGSLTSGSFNIHIAHVGNVGEAQTLRIGTTGNQTRAFIAGIRGITTGQNNAVNVVIDSNGQLGTLSSSREVKDDIADMGEASDVLMKLHPVTFRYKTHQGAGPVQYGLIAEEVADVAPDLVAPGRSRQIETVYYQHLPPMLLNEYQKQQRTIEAQARRIDVQQSEIAELRRAVEVLLARTSPEGRIAAR
ncbi:MAG: tail fiber domain-containing protein [Burkholderiales bacterium]